jgi:hypothetical protein
MTTFRSAVNKDDLMDGDVVLKAGEYNKVGEMKIVAGEHILLGYGENESQEGSPGRIYVDMKDNAAAPGANIEGTVRIRAMSPRRSHLTTYAEYRTEQLRTDKNNRTLQIPFPSQPQWPWISEDKILVVELLPDAAATLSKANSTILFDVNVREIK